MAEGHNKGQGEKSTGQNFLSSMTVVLGTGFSYLHRYPPYPIIKSYLVQKFETIGNEPQAILYRDMGSSAEKVAYLGEIYPP